MDDGLRFAGRPVAWSGPAMLVLDGSGSAGAAPLSGFFFRQTRFLRTLRLEIEGEVPYPCSIVEASPDTIETTAIFPEVDRGGGGGSGSGGDGERHGVLHRAVDLRSRFVVRPASAEVQVTLTSRWQERVALEVAWVLSADFASVDEAEFGQRDDAASPVEVTAAPSGVVFRYLHPQLPLETQVGADGAEWRFVGDRLAARVTLMRQAPLRLGLTIRAHDPLDPIPPDAELARERRRAARRGRLAVLRAPGSPPLVRITNTAIADVGALAMLEGAEDEWLAPAAGVPLYLGLWGRDALTAGWQAGIFDRGESLADAITLLGRRQGRVVDDERDEQPGRIPMQLRMNPAARLGRTRLGRYYGDMASPLMFVISLGYHYALTGDDGFLEQHWDEACRVLAWAREDGDADGDGYLEYLTRAADGPSHQGWKDSENAVVDEAGTQVAPPVAVSEVQGYWYAALQLMAALALLRGERRRALGWGRQAAGLRRRFNRDFWLEDDGYVALGLDAEKRPIRAITSNAGHCLATGIVRREHVPRLVRRMFQSDLFSGWGIRTLSALNPAYNPLDYHLGSVWPVENATILFGLRRYGMDGHAARLAAGMFSLARFWPEGRIPECVGGHARGEAAHPGLYPRANRVQAWNQSAWALVVQALLGLVPCAPLRLLLVDPILPRSVPSLVIDRLRVGDATVSLRLHRGRGGRVHTEVIERDGVLRVVRQPWIESGASLWRRLRSLVP